MPSPATTMLQRVTDLLEGHLQQILRKERDNENRVNLYDVGEYWVAFDRSAYLFEQLDAKAASPVVVHLKDYPFPIVMHTAHYTRVDALCRRHVMSRRTMECLQLMTRPMDSGSYNRWYREQVSPDA